MVAPKLAQEAGAAGEAEWRPAGRQWHVRYGAQDDNYEYGSQGDNGYEYGAQDDEADERRPGPTSTATPPPKRGARRAASGRRAPTTTAAEAEEPAEQPAAAAPRVSPSLRLRQPAVIAEAVAIDVTEDINYEAKWAPWRSSSRCSSS